MVVCRQLFQATAQRAFGLGTDGGGGQCGALGISRESVARQMRLSFCGSGRRVRLGIGHKINGDGLRSVGCQTLSNEDYEEPFGSFLRVLPINHPPRIP